jgi:hypothetical protein
VILQDIRTRLRMEVLVLIGAFQLLVQRSLPVGMLAVGPRQGSGRHGRQLRAAPGVLGDGTDGRGRVRPLAARCGGCTTDCRAPTLDIE